MFIHFALASLKDDFKAQIDGLIQLILEKRRLLFRENSEFITVFQPHIHSKFKNSRFRGKQVIHIPLEYFQQCGNALITSIDEDIHLDPKYDLHFLKENIKMICFINICLTQLKKSPHSKEYGRLGLVFEDNYLRKNGIKQVRYYTEESLFTDPLVVKWNEEFAYRPNLTPEELARKKELEIQILVYRKPATLFESFSESRMLAIEKSGLSIKDVYDRYSIGYNFQTENEWRIVSLCDEEFLWFEESDLRLVIVPDSISKKRLGKYFSTRWSSTPEIVVFPDN